MLGLQITAIVFSVLFAIWVCIQVSKKRLQLKYSLLWLLLSLVVLVVAIIPSPVFYLSEILGFEKPSNFLLFCGIFFLMAISISLSAIVSKQAEKIKSLVQDLAILESKIEDSNSKNS